MASCNSSFSAYQILQAYVQKRAAVDPEAAQVLGEFHKAILQDSTYVQGKSLLDTKGGPVQEFYNDGLKKFENPHPDSIIACVRVSDKALPEFIIQAQEGMYEDGSREMADRLIKVCNQQNEGTEKAISEANMEKLCLILGKQMRMGTVESMVESFWDFIHTL